jgi:HD-GYP domain-containing protein (c-di-GMP phosphodiesterase class II)
MPTAPLPVLHPGTGQPVGPDDLAPLFPLELILQEVSEEPEVAIPDEILEKPGPLTDEEWKFVRRHTLVGERILLAAPALSHVAGIVRSSHERFDGSGYPDGLAGDDIPLPSRIVFLCDAFHAMTSRRAYAARMSEAEASEELHRGVGTQFDPAVVQAFLELLAEREPATAGAAA